MTRKKLIEDIKQQPARFYRVPSDVLRDRRFNDGEKLEILRAWPDGPDIDAVIADLQSRSAAE